MTKIQQVELTLRKKIERLMEREGVTLVRRESFGTLVLDAGQLYRPTRDDCGVCALGAALLGTKADGGWETDDAARVLGISFEEALDISNGFEELALPETSPYCALGDRLRRDYCVEEQQ